MRKLLAVFLLGVALGTGADVAGAAGRQLSCFSDLHVRQYVWTLFERDYTGVYYDLDYKNDYLSDVPLQCKGQALGWGILIAKSVH